MSLNRVEVGGFSHAGCYFFFDYVSSLWTFGATTCGTALGLYVDFGYSVALFGVIMVLDLVTLTVLRTAHRVKSASHAIHQRKEVMFFVQAFATSVTYCCMLICFHVISPLLPAGIALVISRTTVWEMAHAGGGNICSCFVIFPMVTELTK
ncbi:hypothetical protein ANCCEY_01747 [Ancylostoma ceylanicum]|uniref:7TM GPCR serpentine receptor class x (Srx) domain-containing protein n=1 Tax=Ancylostoma ceylanicum TaxID=53326 RepID=A0A0D6M6J0_9BILA|nr:hypothetical protein ANCCEY_01747 [Ancylostoma ceylanicum]